MTRRSLTALLAAAIAATAVASAVAAKPRKRTPPPAADTWNRPTSQQPARMIEVRPGLWVSSYGCVTDEGYGRFAPCDRTDKQ